MDGLFEKKPLSAYSTLKLKFIEHSWAILEHAYTPYKYLIS